MHLKLAQPFNFKRILFFTFPTILNMVLLSLYTTVDGIMVSRLVSENALAAVNIVFPVVSFVLAVALMLASGGNAIIANLLGQRKQDEASKKFTLIYGVGILLALLLTGIVFLLLDPLLKGLGATSDLYHYAAPYLKIMMLFSPMMVLQILTQTFMVTEGKPMLGLALSMLSGIINVGLDYLFMAHFKMGISGAALATGMGMAFTGIYGLLYFTLAKKRVLAFKWPKMNRSFVFAAMGNGASEMVNNLSVAFTTFLFNVTMVRLLGNEGVVAITIILYVQFIQMAIYFGYSQGISPVISFKYGANQIKELKAIVYRSFLFIGLSSVLVIGFSLIFVDAIIGLFVPSGAVVFDLTKEGFLIYLTAYVFMGFNIFVSAMFTALGNGRVSAFLSFFRTFVFIIGALLTLPNLLGLIGVWIAVPISEVISALLSYISYRNGKERYGY